jgi:hypothetical protein
MYLEGVGCLVCGVWTSGSSATASSDNVMGHGEGEGEAGMAGEVGEEVVEEEEGETAYLERGILHGTHSSWNIMPHSLFLMNS